MPQGHLEPQRHKIRARERFGGRISLFPPSSRQALERSDVWEILDAVEEGEIEKDNQQEHTGTEEVRKTARASSSNRPERSKKKRSKVAPKKKEESSLKEQFNAAGGRKGKKVKV